MALANVLQPSLNVWHEQSPVEPLTSRALRKATKDKLVVRGLEALVQVVVRSHRHRLWWTRRTQVVYRPLLSRHRLHVVSRSRLRLHARPLSRLRLHARPLSRHRLHVVSPSRLRLHVRPPSRLRLQYRLQFHTWLTCPLPHCWFQNSLPSEILPTQTSGWPQC